VIGEDIELDIEPGPGLWTVQADEGQIELVLMNLCFNARDAMPQGGTLTIRTANMSLDHAYCLEHAWAREGRFVLLSVRDTGCGMSREVLQQAFDPFFTTKGVGKGTGLGLSMVYGIVRQHNGIIRADSTVGEGSTFRVFLPAVDEDPAVVERESLRPEDRGTETVLVAEDEETVRALTTRMLRQAGYKVLTAANGEEALKLLERESANVDLALLDVVMPKLGGCLVARRIRETYPGSRILFASGYSQDAVDGELDLDGDVELLEKPYEVHDLLRKVRRALDR
jgi:two-component system, cell cycle sensor histidine kinase and response regulator CckA